MILHVIISYSAPTMTTFLYTYVYHLFYNKKGGSSIVLVNPTKNVRTTKDLKNDYTVIAALDTETTGLLGGNANGVFLDLDDFLNET